MNYYIAIFIILLNILGLNNLRAQTADEIIKNYIETTGGANKFLQLNGIKTTGYITQGATRIPLEVVKFKDGRQFLKLDFQGTPVFQNVYDGNTFWSTNFKTMKAETLDATSQKVLKAQTADFPDAIYNYEKNGYNVELMGKETLNNQEVYKVKLQKLPLEVKGEKLEQITYYYFSTKSKLLIGHESELQAGQHKGLVALTLFSDYRTVEGLLFPFEMRQGIKGMPLQKIIVEDITLNPEVNNKLFQFKG